MYSFSSRVRYSEVDEHEVLSPAAMINYLQDCSLFQTEELKSGLSHVREAGLRWLLSAWHIYIDQMPRYGEPITVSTWATGFKGFFAGRNFTIADASGELLIRADSQWFMYGDAAGRPVRPPAEELAFYAGDLENDTPLDLPPIQRKIEVTGEAASADPVSISQAYIDTNHHVNNAQYVAIALGVLPEEALQSELEVQYVQAAHLGDVLYPHIYRAEDTTEDSAAASCWTVSLDNAEGKPYAIVRVR